MRSVARHPDYLPAVDAALRDVPWLEGELDARVQRFAAVLVDTFRASLSSLSPSTAALAAFTAARGELPLADPAWHETWARVVLLWIARELARASSRARFDGRTYAPELMHAAMDTLRGSHALAAGGVVTMAAHPVPVERLAEGAREAFSDPGFTETARAEYAGFFHACFHQLRHATTLLILGEPNVERIVHAAVLRADRAARRSTERAWAQLPAHARRPLAVHALIEAGAALALAVPSHAGSGEIARDACIWFARTAHRIALASTDADSWFAIETDTPRSPGPTAMDAPRGAPARGVETIVKETQPTMLKTLETDARDAAWRTAGSQFVKLTREPLVGMLSRHLAPGDESMRARLAAFLETEIGTALLASLLSMGLSAMPAGAGDVPQRLARELRVRAMADAGDVLADLLMAPLRQVASTYLQDPGFTVRPANTATLGDANALRHEDGETDNVVPLTAQG